MAKQPPHDQSEPAEVSELEAFKTLARGIFRVKRDDLGESKLHNSKGEPKLGKNNPLDE